METFFYVMGGVLVLLALGISFVGIRSDNFPTPGMLRIGVLIVAVVVGATAYGAVELSAEEAQHRMEEENVHAAEEADVTTEENAEEAGGGTATAEGESELDGSGEGPRSDASADAENGEQVFVDNGCGSCHTLAELGPEAAGTIGPNLDEALVDADPEFIRTSIVDPSAEVAEGFGDGIMPEDYEENIPTEDLDALVAFLQQATQQGAGAQPAQAGGNE
jgi:mono/diheme cytochrome c family protein